MPASTELVCFKFCFSLFRNIKNNSIRDELTITKQQRRKIDMTFKAIESFLKLSLCSLLYSNEYFRKTVCVNSFISIKQWEMFYSLI